MMAATVQDRDARRARHAMEYVWRASPTLGASAQILAGANLGGSYGPSIGRRLIDAA